MTWFLEFPTSDGTSVAVEVEDTEASSAGGVEKAGLRDRRAGEMIARTGATLEEAIGTAVRHVASFVDAMATLPRAPSEVEVTFGLKATGDCGRYGPPVYATNVI